MTGSNRMMVADSQTEGEILKCWLFIETSILKNIQTQSNEKEDVLDFLKLKFESLAKSQGLIELN